MAKLPSEYKRQFGHKFSNFGTDGAGHDFKAFGDTSGKYVMWDASADKLIVNGAFEYSGSLDLTGDMDFIGTLTVGVDGTGHDVKFYSATASKYFLWDESADKLIIVGDFDITGNSQFTGTVTVGTDGAGHDFKAFGDTSGKYVMWDASADKLIIDGSADLGDSCEANAYTVGGVSGVDYGPAAVSSITIVKGIVTACS